MFKFNILVLHRVVKEQPSTFIDVTIKSLKHILKSDNCDFLSIDQVLNQKEKPDKSKKFICLTFDDGYSSDYSIVLPELKKKNAYASFFIVTDWIDTPGYLTKKQVKDLSTSGMQIGSHSKSHPNFLEMTSEERLNELKQSKLVLEEIIGKEVTSFSFPFGFFNETCTQEVFSVGYQVCCNSMHGHSKTNSSIMRRNSINANSSTSRIDKIIEGKICQITMWYFEDKIKIFMKTYFPKTYICVRDMLSSI